MIESEKIDQVKVQHPGHEYFHWAEITLKHPTQYECQHGYRFEKEFFKASMTPSLRTQRKEKATEAKDHE